MIHGELQDLIKAEARLWFRTGNLSMNEELDPGIMARLTADVERITEEVSQLWTGDLPIQDRLLPLEWL